MKTLLTTMLALSIAFASAQEFSQLTKITSDDRAPFDEFGDDVAIDGNFAIVGVKLEDENASGTGTAADAGSAYIYRRSNDTWTQEAKLVAADRTSQDHFGGDVDISGNYCIIGARFNAGAGDEAGAGAAYIFERSEGGVWTQTAKLEAPIQKSSDYFGFSVAISGDFAVVGAFYEDEDENEENEILSAGSAYIFERAGDATWSLDQKIVASDRTLDDRFGMSVDIDGDYLVVGAEFDDVSGDNGLQSNAGSAYVFELDGGVWTEVSQLTASDYSSGDRFGWDVAIDDNTIIVGAYKDWTDEMNANGVFEAGSVYLFERGGGAWPQVKKVVGSDRSGLDWYGYSVAIDGDYAAVGAYRADLGQIGDPPYTDAGAIYMLYNDPDSGWTELEKINHDDRGSSFQFPPSYADQLGISVAIDGNTVMAGASAEDEDETGDNPIPSAGAAYFFTRDTPCETPFPAVSNLTSEVEAAGVSLSWEPVIGSIGCQVQGAVAGGPIRTVIKVNDDANEAFVSASLLSPGATYFWRVRCGCSTSIIGPWSTIATFVAPGGSIATQPNQELVSEVNLYPNPASESVNIALYKVGENAVVILTDAQGRQLSSRRFSGSGTMSFDLQSIPNGMYFLRVINDGKQLVKKLLVAK